MYSYRKLHFISYKNSLIGIISGIILIILFFLMMLLDIYDYKIFYAEYKNGYLEVEVPIMNSDAVKNGNYLKINNKKYKYDINNVYNTYEKDYINYQIYQIKCNEKFFENESQYLTFYYNKEKIMQKIIKFIF